MPPIHTRSDKTPEQVSGAYSHVIVDKDNHVIIRRQTNGQSIYLHYRSERGARGGLARAALDIRDAKIIERP